MRRAKKLNSKYSKPPTHARVGGFDLPIQIREVRQIRPEESAVPQALKMESQAIETNEKPVTQSGVSAMNA